MLYQRIQFRSERVVLQTVTELYAHVHTEVRTSKASEFLREEFPEELSEYDRHLTPSAILTPDIRKRNPAFLPVPMPKRQVRYGPYYLMERSPMVRPQYIPQSGLVDVEHQLARLTSSPSGIVRRNQEGCYHTDPQILHATTIWVLGDMFRALCAGVGCDALVVTIWRFGAQSYGSGCYMFE